MRNTFSLLLLPLLLTISLNASGKDGTLKITATPTTEKATPITYTQSTDDDDFNSVKETIEMAIADQGLIVSGTLHISEMLNRTGKDLGFKPIYKVAEGVEFCSSKISHLMAQVDPSNISMCPFTVTIYQLTEDPSKTYLSFRHVSLKGDGVKVEEKITALLQTIVDEAL
ncbi:MAG: hypothetical protein KAH22_11200 [Thiotrichaceae bacterium]|nr:hypothetical protein [Thiotrichaceae bacterium]